MIDFKGNGDIFGQWNQILLRSLISQVAAVAAVCAVLHGSGNAQVTMKFARQREPQVTVRSQ